MPLRPSAALPIAIAIAMMPRAGDAATYDWAGRDDAEFRLWIPDDQEVIYGLYVIWNESGTPKGDTRELAERERIQTWARTFGFGIVGTSLPDPGYADHLIEALADLADMSGHPEIEHAPVLCEGISLGGYAAIEFATRYPERTIGYLGGAAGRMPDGTDAPGFARTPGLFYHGEDDPNIDSARERRDEFIALRQSGVQIAFWIQWQAGHERLHADEIGWKFLADAVRLRYPEGTSPLAGPVSLIDIPDDLGWLASHATWEDDITAIDRFGDFAGDALADAFWLPSRDTAFVYRAHATRNGPLRFIQPTDMVSWVIVEPGDPVPIEVSLGGLEGVTQVDVFDGSAPIAALTQAPYQTQWIAQGVGAHSLVAVATLGDGTQRTGTIAPVLVAGTARPGGGGLDGEGGPDGGPQGRDDGGGSGATGEGGGCGCRTGGPGAASHLLPLLLAFAVAWCTRRRTRNLTKPVA
jgi:MYXO-CTERM domain-containing protein